MEGGTESIACNYNVDHLATSDIKHNEKRWLACGFNQFGQLSKFHDERIIRYFKEIDVRATHLISSWSYVAAANGCSLQIRGLINSRTKSEKLIKAENEIKCLAGCDRYCLILLNNGTVYKYGIQCEDGLKEVIFQSNESFTPKNKSIFGKTTSACASKVKIEKIACGNNIMIALGLSNEVFTGTTQVHCFPKHVRSKQLVCGFEHALMLTHNGDIYAWGNGLRGQLGLGVIGVEEKPVLIEAIAGIKIICIAAAGWHSAAISAFGDIYTWGFNSNGQLGIKMYKNCTIKEPAIYVVPQVVYIMELTCCDNKEQDCFPTKIATGARHTMVEMNCGAVYAAGWNAYGQLGLPNKELYTDQFQYVLKFKNCKDNVEIVSGSWNTLIGMRESSKREINENI